LNLWNSIMKLHWRGLEDPERKIRTAANSDFASAVGNEQNFGSLFFVQHQ
jgi:hypothetical protein